jgi:hypothetical protein
MVELLVGEQRDCKFNSIILGTLLVLLKSLFLFGKLFFPQMYHSSYSGVEYRLKIPASLG